MSVLRLRSGSAAEDAAYVALHDIASLDLPSVRVIGGQMVSLHVHRHGLDLPRATADADVGLTPFVLKSSNIADKLHDLGYKRSEGNRFVRPLVDLPTVDGHIQATIDLLVPAMTSRARSSVTHGEFNTTEVPGLAFAFQRDPVSVPVEATLRNGDALEFTVDLPDEAAALALKSLARTVRMTDNDAVDVWRCLEVCRIGDLSDVTFGSDHDQVTSILRNDFGREGAGMDQLIRARQLNAAQSTQLRTRMQALIASILN